MTRFTALLLMLCVMNVIYAQQWIIDYQTAPNEEVVFFHGDKSLQYDYAVGEYVNNETDEKYPIALCIDLNGDYLDKVFYKEGRTAKFTSVLGLGDGNAFVTATCSDDTIPECYEKLWVAILNPNLEVIEECNIELNAPYLSFSTTTHALVNDEDEIVLVTLVTDSIPEHTSIIYDYSFYKFDARCNLLKQSYLENQSRQCNIDDFTRIPDTDIYAIFGYGLDVSGMANVIYIDDELNYLSMSFLDEQQEYPDLMLPYRMSLGFWYDKDHFLMSAQTVQTSGLNNWRPFVVKMDRDMNVIKTLDFERVDTTDYVAEYKSVAYVNPDVIYVSTFWDRGSFLDVFPNSMTLFLINEKLDLLGRKTMVYDNYYYYVLHIHPSYDGACIVQGVAVGDGHDRSVIYKFKSEDFEMLTEVTDNSVDFEISSYPNPVSSVLNIDVESINNDNVRVILFDMMGRRYLDKDVRLDGDMLTLDVTPLPKGTYFYKIVIDDRNEIKKRFIKN